MPSYTALRPAIWLAALLAAWVPAHSAERPMLGVAYGPYRLQGQGPGGPPLTDAQILQDLALIHRAGFRRVRTFGTANGLDRVPALALAHYPDLTIFQGVYACGVDHDNTANPHATRAQLDAAVRLALAFDNVAAVVVGNECLPGEPEACPNPISLPQLLADLGEARARLDAGGRRGVAVTCALSMMAAVGAHASQGRPVVARCDLVLVNIHPFFAPVPADRAAADVLASYRKLQELYAGAGKPIVIGETGWPSAGGANGPALPGPDAQRRFVHELFRTASGEAIQLFWFEMFDEPWKIEMGGVGPHWGLYDREGRPKFELPW
jgi:glucan 1,3-beta-glucosidase